MYPVFWTKQAKSLYIALLQYLKEEVSTDIAIDLDEKIEKLEARLSRFRYSCPPSGKAPQYRRCVISKSTSVIVEIRGPMVFIISIIDNRMANLYS